MEQRIIIKGYLEAFRDFLNENEKSRATIEKYMRDIRHFAEYTGNKRIDKVLMLGYKSALEQEYAITSANSMIAAINAFLKFIGWNDLCMKQFRIQRSIYCPEEKELTKAEYVRLVEAAKKEGNEQLNLIIQTICSTGIRVSEL